MHKIIIMVQVFNLIPPFPPIQSSYVQYILYFILKVYLIISVFKYYKINYSKDCTSTGHALGDAKLRRNTPGPERNLSPTAICIVRAIMHSALLFCSCHFQDMSAELAELVKPPVKHDLLPQFFWMHLKKDIEHLSRVTGRGMEESALIIHFVLHDILLTPPSG